MSHCLYFTEYWLTFQWVNDTSGDLNDLSFKSSGSKSYLDDIYMGFDGRGDGVGPGNSGFIYIKSNCKTKLYTLTLVKYIGLVLYGQSDQRHWNMFLRIYDFRFIKFTILPPNHFIGGWQWDLKRKNNYLPKYNNETWLIHSSCTADHIKKIYKFQFINKWYFKRTCNYYNRNLVPKLFDWKEMKQVKPLTSQNRTYKWDQTKKQDWWNRISLFPRKKHSTELQKTQNATT